MTTNAADMTVASGSNVEGPDNPPCPPDDPDVDEPVPPLPPDGGWGWMVVIASLVCNIIVDGVCFSFGIFLPEFVEFYGEGRAKTAWVGSLIPGMYLGMGPIVSALANKYGCRSVTILGSLIASFFFFVSTFSPNVDVLIVLYGVMGGIGFGLMYLPAIVIVGFYFDKRRALATGLAVCGSGIGTFAFAPLGRLLLDHYGWQGGYWIISGIILNGVVCGAIFRPLEASHVRRTKKDVELEEMPNRGTIMNKIIEEKKRMRTISTGSLDGSVITTTNALIKDPEKIKLIKNVQLARLDEENEEEAAGAARGQAKGPSTSKFIKQRMFTPQAGKDKGGLGLPKGGVIINKHLNIEHRPAAPLPPHVTEAEGDSCTRSLNLIPPATPPLNHHVMRTRANSESMKQRPRTRSSTVDDRALIIGKSSTGSKFNLTPEQQRAREVARPMYRRDIFFTGSVTSLREYKDTSDMASYVASHTSIPPPDDDEGNTDRWTPLISVLRDMFDFSLLKSPTFVLLCTTSVLAMTGFFTPFVYITDNAIELGIPVTDATLLLSVLGVCNTFGRIICGWVSDRSWADCLLIHNVALVLAGAATCCVPLLKVYALLVIYCIIFGSCIAAFICLRSIVLVDLLGLQKLTNSFGVLLLFQGIASLVGSPIAGAIFDMTRSYTWSFVVAGILIALSGLIALPVRHLARWENNWRLNASAHGSVYRTVPAVDEDTTI